MNRSVTVSEISWSPYNGEDSARRNSRPSLSSRWKLFCVYESKCVMSCHLLSGICPHQGCTVMAESNGFYCPCHGSEFTLTGALVRGPAASGLGPLPFTQPTPGVLRITPT